jgi:maltose/moltooligosaccharide transporter
LLIQPIIGAMSDKTWHQDGDAETLLFYWAIVCSILFLFPFSSSLWMAAGLLWILDVGNNTAMEPYRALFADTWWRTATGFQAQSFLQVSVSFSVYIHWNFPLIIVGYTGELPNWMYASFFIGQSCPSHLFVEYE